MHEDDITGGSLELLVDARRREDERDRELAARAEDARKQADEARLELAKLAAPAVWIVALRLAGEEKDNQGRPVTKEREDTAWEVLSRVGIPRLRATAIAASIAAFTEAPAPGSPGWKQLEDDGEDERQELDPATVDAQIESFLAGARAARDLDGGED